MTISVNRFNSALKSANSQITSQTVEDATSSIVEQQKALNECKAGAIGDVQNGIKLLSENPIKFICLLYTSDAADE